MTFSKLARFSELPREGKLAFVEAFILLIAAWSFTKILPYAWWTRLLGHSGTGQQLVTTRSSTQVSELVNWAIGAAARQIPWEIVCLPQAIAGRWMLARRHVDCTLCIGVRSTPGPAARNAEMHAWLALEDWMGEKNGAGAGYTVIARFGARHDTV